MSSATERQRPAQSPGEPLEVESPIINSPFFEPQDHWEIEKAKAPVKAAGRRPASYYFRVPERAKRSTKSRKQEELFAGAEVGQKEELALVNRLRHAV